MPRRTWFRLIALQRWRGQVADDAAWRMARHLTHRADERGRLRDLPAVMGSYAAVHQVSVRTAWADFKRLRLLGYVRQTAAAAPGRPARYVLSVPADLPAELPRSLARAVRDEIDPLADRAAGTPTRAQVDAALSDCEVMRYGSASRRGAPREPIMARKGCGRLHTSPYTREGSPPSPPDPGAHSPQRPRRIRRGGLGDDEKTAALYVVKACAGSWEAQRGRGRGLEPDKHPGIMRMLALLLRWLPPGEVAELITERTRSAVDLAAVVHCRVSHALKLARQRIGVPVDEDGSGYEAVMAARAAEAERRFEATRQGRAAFAAARAALEARLAAARRDDPPEEPRDGRERRTGPPAPCEPEEVFLATLTEPERDPAADRAWLLSVVRARRGHAG